MSDDYESGPMPLDGKTPLTEDEVRRLRRMLLEEDRASWARRRLKIILPWLVGLVTGAWALVDWIIKHISWK